MFYPLNAIKVQ